MLPSLALKPAARLKRLEEGVCRCRIELTMLYGYLVHCLANCLGHLIRGPCTTHHARIDVTRANAADGRGTSSA